MQSIHKTGQSMAIQKPGVMDCHVAALLAMMKKSLEGVVRIYFDWPEFIMKTNIINSPFWSTTAFGDDSQRSQLEAATLHAHIVSCRRSRQLVFMLHCLAETMYAFVTARVITTLLVLTLLMSIFSQAL